MGNIKVEYLVLSENMSQDQRNNTEFKTFEITLDMILELVTQNVSIKTSEYICPNNFFLIP